MLVRDIMNKRVFTAEPEINVREAARIMADNKVGSIVLKKNEKMTGIVTDRDILILVAKGDERGMDEIHVSEIMTRFIISIDPDSKVEKSVELMLKYNIKKLPVVDNERLVGIITSTDIALVEPKIIDNLGKMLSHKLREL